MKTYQFKTNMNCGGCVATVEPYLNEVKGISEWQVATDQPEKTLTVKAESVSPGAIQQAVEAAGFSAEPITAWDRIKGIFQS
jgi:copper chaperone